MSNRMSRRKRATLYATSAVACELTAVALALTANLTRDFHGWEHLGSQLLAALGMVALGAFLELVHHD